MESEEFTHFNANGMSRMVNVIEKPDTQREAVAKGSIHLLPQTVKMIREGKMKKGDVLAVAQVGGIMGAKKTFEIIPMCHNIVMTGCDINFTVLEDKIEIEAIASTYGKTGIEMEALTAVTVSALTIYDMCKSVDKTMRIGDIRLVSKLGGKSGNVKYE